MTETAWNRADWAWLPIPPLEMRVLVGPTEPSAFDNPTGELLFAEMPASQFASVLDFGCGCGRVARQLIQQVPRPRRYLGVDLHRGMIEWCRSNLEGVATGFEFVHHDVFERAFNPGVSKPRWLPFPVGEERFSLVICWSVFTHLLEAEATAYLHEIRRVLAPGGTAVTTWFFFEKDDFPMMQEEQNALYVNAVHPENAVIFDRGWFRRSIADAGLSMSRITAPAIRGFQWHVELVASGPGGADVDFPEDTAPRGRWRAHRSTATPHLVGIEDTTTASLPRTGSARPVQDARFDDAGLPVPDDDLRWRVTGGHVSEDDFRELGRRSVDDLQRALRALGRELFDFERVLDFGCGSGRVVRHLSAVATNSSVHGCDIDQEAIAWAEEHLPFASFVCNDWLPPTIYADGAFDLVINHSVFTHLPEDYQDAWLTELRRIVEPGGVLVLSVSGQHAFAGLVQSYLEFPADPSAIEATIRERGFLYISDDSWTGSGFPSFYHSTFHSREYVMRHWGEYFEILAYFPRGALDFQDVVLCRRP